jgi:hypothetical protein
MYKTNLGVLVCEVRATVPQLRLLNSLRHELESIIVARRFILKGWGLNFILMVGVTSQSVYRLFALFLSLIFLLEEKHEGVLAVQ